MYHHHYHLQHCVCPVLRKLCFTLHQHYKMSTLHIILHRPQALPYLCSILGAEHYSNSMHVAMKQDVLLKLMFLLPGQTTSHSPCSQPLLLPSQTITYVLAPLITLGSTHLTTYAIKISSLVWQIDAFVVCAYVANSQVWSFAWGKAEGENHKQVGC